MSALVSQRTVDFTIVFVFLSFSHYESRKCRYISGEFFPYLLSVIVHLRQDSEGRGCITSYVYLCKTYGSLCPGLITFTLYAYILPGPYLGVFQSAPYSLEPPDMYSRRGIADFISLATG